MVIELVVHVFADRCLSGVHISAIGDTVVVFRELLVIVEAVKQAERSLLTVHVENWLIEKIMLVDEIDLVHIETVEALRATVGRSW